MSSPAYPLQQSASYQYLDEGPSSHAPAVVLLHGMLGDLSNWTPTLTSLTEAGYRVLVPLLPVYDLPLKQTSVPGLAHYLRGFLEHLDVGPVVLAGNSLGGHVAIFYTHYHPQDVQALILSGSSGIYEMEMGTSTPRRQDRAYIKDRAAFTFYDPVHASDELVDEMYELVNDRQRIVRLIKMARSAKKETVTDHLGQIDVPVLLVWGRDDRITPPDVAHQFEALLPKAELHFLDECGHAPMIEHPDDFNRLTLTFLEQTIGAPSPSLAG